MRACIFACLKRRKGQKMTKIARKGQQDSNNELYNSLGLSGFGEVLLTVDGLLKPLLIEIVLLVAIQQVAQKRNPPLREQLHIWRSFDV